jgi:tetratricopeptide (TPR) repeat protein
MAARSSLALGGTVFAQLQSSPSAINASPSSAESATHDLVVALERATSAEEQERLLGGEPDLVNSSLLKALKELTGPFIQKGDYAQALRLSQLAARIAERIGDPGGLGDALTDLGEIYGRQNRAAQALDYLQKSLAIYEQTQDKREWRALYEWATHYLNRPDQTLEYVRRSLALSEEIGDESSVASSLIALGGVHQTKDVMNSLWSVPESQALSERLNDKAILEGLATLVIFFSGAAMQSTGIPSESHQN